MAITGTETNDILRGTSNWDTLQGLGGDDILYGLVGNDTLDGGSGADQLYGGQGNDSYIVDNKGDTANELENQGIDTVMASVTFALAANLENLTLTGNLAINGTGNDLNNILIGNDVANHLTGLGGNDTLDGGKGADRMAGGFGDDIYVVDNAGDIVQELSNQGIDTVRSSVNYVLGAHLENLTLTGDAAIDGAGNGFANILTGNSAANGLNGGGNNDTLDGMQGADKMSGGLGNDLYIVDDKGDGVTELANQGTDTVKSSVDFTLGANVENLTLTASVNGTGNSLDNIIEGNLGKNTLLGNGGNDTLKGGGGLDSLGGGAGNDHLVVADAGFQLADGGKGDDTLTIAFDGDINLSGSTGKITSIESITLDGAHDVLAPTAKNVLDMTDSRNTLTINGDAGDSVVVGGWTPQGTKGGYQLFTQLGATLKVETGISTYSSLYVIDDETSAADASTHLTKGADLVEINLGNKPWSALQDFSLAGFGADDKLRININDGQVSNGSSNVTTVLANGDWLKTNVQTSVTYIYIGPYSSYTSVIGKDTILAGPKQLTLRSWSQFGSGTHTVHVAGLPDTLAPSQVEFF